MSDIISILPDHIANQIAAGEVVQRPASVVKELLENSIDAKATQIKLLIKEAGKQLIQVVDDGIGMSETDARRSFERHATSKIRKSEDLFALTTMGFRGEALASIAAVAQVELRTRQHNQELGTKLLVENSRVQSQEPCQAAPGTQFIVRNLFYNTPARRQFLKSDAVEFKHITEEFVRVALAHPEVDFTLFHNDEPVYRLPSENLRKRIYSLFGQNKKDKLLPIDEQTDLIRISGFAGKPELARKSRGEQFLFVNQRFIRSSYINHAISHVFEGLTPADSFPFYVIFVDIDPGQIDVNVHPTKTEIKFSDERLIYNMISVAVRHSLNKHSILPGIDFDTPPDALNPYKKPQVSRSHDPELGVGSTTQRSNFGYDRSSSVVSPETDRQASNLSQWQNLYNTGSTEQQPHQDEEVEGEESSITLLSQADSTPINKLQTETPRPYQLHQSYIVAPVRNGFLLIDQQAAHLRILFEENINRLSSGVGPIQRVLFPRNVDLQPSDTQLVLEMMSDLIALGLDISYFGGNTFVIHGIPAELPPQDEVELFESLLEQVKESQNLRLEGHQRIALGMARSTCIRPGKTLSPTEMQSIIDRLFACEIPEFAPNGLRTFVKYDLDEVRKMF
jgi:DNA mismatch repair protein MutL